MDWYLGIKPVTGKITWDLGVIYYTYPNRRLGFDASGVVDRRDYNYVELKVGASAEVWKDGTLGVTVFYSPDYQYETGSVWTIEATFAQVLPKFKLCTATWTPTFSALSAGQTALPTRPSMSTTSPVTTTTTSYWNVGPDARLPREVVDGLPLLGYQHRQATRFRASCSTTCSPATSGSWAPSSSPSDSARLRMPESPRVGALLFLGCCLGEGAGVGARQWARRAAPGCSRTGIGFRWKSWCRSRRRRWPSGS